MSVIYKTTDNAQGQLNAGILASALTIVLKTGEGAEFPQPYTGTASSTGSNVALNDTGDLGNVNVGDFIENATDGSWAFVTVAGANSITTTRLQGGSDNTWTSGDTWYVNRFIITIDDGDANGENVTTREKVRISNRSTDSLTVASGDRGFDGSAAAAWDADDYVRLSVGSAYLAGVKEVVCDIAEWVNTTISDLASTSATKGASTVGVQDSGSYFTGTNVETVLQELGPSITAASPTGAMILWTTDTAPTGWLLCDGASLLRADYAALFGVIGTVYGSADGTHFNVPDMRGRFPLGQDDMGGSAANRVTDTDADTVGGADGDETKTLIEANLPAHYHTYGDAGSGAATGVRDIDASATITGTQKNTSTVGSGTAFDIMPPFITLNYIIKT